MNSFYCESNAIIVFFCFLNEYPIEFEFMAFVRPF